MSQLLNDPELTDLVLNGHGSAFANIAGQWKSVPCPFDSASALQEFALELASSARRRLDYACPFADISVGSLRYHLALPLSGDRIHVSSAWLQVAGKGNILLTTFPRPREP